MRKIGFTLAEVLVTLGIIGVVAAITIPSLITKINDRQNIVRWRKTYSVINDVFKRIVERDVPVCAFSGCAARGPQINNANERDFYFSNDFLEAFIEELKPMDMCYNQAEPRCDVRYKTWANIKSQNYGRYAILNKPKEFLNSYNLAAVRFLLKDGSMIYMGGSHGGPWLSVDVNGANNGPNQVGRDMFVIKVFENKILPMGAQGTFNTNANGEKCLCGDQYGWKSSANYFAGGGGTGEVVSGGCCSDYYIKNNK